MQSLHTHVSSIVTIIMYMHHVVFMSCIEAAKKITLNTKRLIVSDSKL